MSTHSAIIIKTAEGYEGIYCHWDGYPSHHRPILNTHYNTQPKAQALVNLGNLSSLATRMNAYVTHTFENPKAGVCVAYGRDRGEADTGKVKGGSVYEIRLEVDAEYVYVFENNKWTVTK